MPVRETEFWGVGNQEAFAKKHIYITIQIILKYIFSARQTFNLEINNMSHGISPLCTFVINLNVNIDLRYATVDKYYKNGTRQGAVLLILVERAGFEPA